MPSTLNKLNVNVYRLLEGLGLYEHSEFSILAASSYPFQANSQLIVTVNQLILMYFQLSTAVKMAHNMIFSKLLNHWSKLDNLKTKYIRTQFSL